MTRQQAQEIRDNLQGWNDPRVIQDQYLADYDNPDNAWYVQVTDPVTGRKAVFDSIKQDQARWI